jgi:hypothetical protein
MIKKILALTTIAMFCASKVGAQSLSNELMENPNTPIVTVGGFINFSGVGRSQAKDYSKTRLPDAVIANSSVNPEYPGTQNRYSNIAD